MAHFDYVRSHDLEKIGLGKPAIRRLMDAIKKQRAIKWQRIVLSKLVGNVKQKPVEILFHNCSDKSRLLNGSLRLTDHSSENLLAHLSEEENYQAQLYN